MKMFPILKTGRDFLEPQEIPWDIIAPHEAQAQNNHGGQTLARLAERGGLCSIEMFHVLHDLEYKDGGGITRRHADAFIRRMLSERNGWPHGVEKCTIYERNEDMSPDGRLQVLIEDDGDAIITLIPPAESQRSYPSVQFCTYTGGGRSPAVRTAIVKLAKAIADDNKENPISGK